MRILILGAGATGGYFGARLVEAGADVTFLVRPNRAQSLKSKGLTVKSGCGDLHLASVNIIEKATEPFDTVILSCKAYDLQSAIDSVKPACAKSTTVIPLLNGMSHLSVLQQKFGPQAVLGGMCIISAKLDDDGAIVHLNDTHTFKFGELSGGSSERVGALAKIVSSAKFDWTASEKIQQDMWEKWAMLAPLAGITCLMRATVGQVVRAPGGVKFADQFFDECLSVMKAEGFELRDEYTTSVRKRSTDPNSKLTASMLRDIECGGKVESEQILGDLVSLAKKHDLSVPLLETAYLHVKAYENRCADESAANKLAGSVVINTDLEAASAKIAEKFKNSVDESARNL